MSKYVGPQSSADGLSPFNADRVSRDGGAITSGLHGKYYEQAARGRAYFGVGASTGIALIAPATGGGHPTLWNPAGSGRNLSIIRVELSPISATEAPTALEWAATRNTGSAVGTGLAIATATRVTPDSCLIGGAQDAVGVWSPTTNTFTAAPTYVRPLGLSTRTVTSGAVINGTVYRLEYDGDLCLAPGVALSLCSQAATTTELIQVAVVWEEIDI